MSLNEEERKAIVTYRLEKSYKSLQQAKGVVDKGYWEVVANRLYYAAYYAVSALLIANKYTAKTHEGFIQVFGLNFIKTGIVNNELGKTYSKLFSLRLTGDYEDHYNLEESDVVPMIEPTERLIEVISSLIKQAIN